MLLRLRQLANHPWLLVRAKGEPYGPNDLQLGADNAIIEHEPEVEVTRASELARVIALKGQAFVDQVRAKFKARTDAAALAEKNDANAEADGDRECPICMEPLIDSLVTGCCIQEFCPSCVDELKPAENGDADVDGDVDQKSCPTCRGKLTHDTLFRSFAFEDEPKEASEEPAVKRESGSTIIPGAKIEDLDNVKFADDEEMPDVSMIGNGMGRKNKMAIYDSDDEDVKPDIKPDIKGKGKARADSDTEDEDEYKVRTSLPDSSTTDRVQHEALMISRSYVRLISRTSRARARLASSATTRTLTRTLTSSQRSRAKGAPSVTTLTMILPTRRRTPTSMTSSPPPSFCACSP
jgi:hypothetical protein